MSKKKLGEICKILSGYAYDSKLFTDNPCETPLIRISPIAKMEYQAATEVFSEFINDQSLTQAQIVFVKKVIDYIVQNGYIENPAELMKPPFDKPQGLMKLFDGSKQKRMVELVAKIKENAIKIVG